MLFKCKRQSEAIPVTVLYTFYTFPSCCYYTFLDLILLIEQNVQIEYEIEKTGSTNETEYLN